ncbi:MAG: 2-oxo-4-hydroxy-4-carboxy-5-ureidoimidazoline decarboxylase [Gemmatimonadales bacterium]
MDELNALSDREALDAFTACLASPTWVSRLVRARPFATRHALMETAEIAWRELGPDEWNAAIAHHPRIGRSTVGASASASTNEHSAGWSADEQSAARSGDSAMAARMTTANAEYERRFGHRFIISATGKSAHEILDAIRTRLAHDPVVESLVTAEELRKIARLRLDKLIPAA